MSCLLDSTIALRTYCPTAMSSYPTPFVTDVAVHLSYPTIVQTSPSLLTSNPYCTTTCPMPPLHPPYTLRPHCTHHIPYAPTAPTAYPTPPLHPPHTLCPYCTHHIPYAPTAPTTYPTTLSHDLHLSPYQYLTITLGLVQQTYILTYTHL